VHRLTGRDGLVGRGASGPCIVGIHVDECVQLGIEPVDAFQELLDERLRAEFTGRDAEGRIFDGHAATISQPRMQCRGAIL
jgi:hypothetical protein